MKTRILWGVLLIALVTRVAILAVVWKEPGNRIYPPDAKDYIDCARSIAEHGTFQVEGRPHVLRTPGYPLLLALSLPWGESWWRVVLVGQVILDVVLVYLTFLLGRMLAGPVAGLIAAALMAFEPLAAGACLRILSDTVYAVLFTVAVILFVHDLRSGRTWALVSGALVLAAACYVRPVGLVVSVVVVAAMLVVGGRRRWWRAGVVAIIVAAAVAPWVVRNAVVADYVGFSSYAGYAMYYYAVPEVLAAAEGISPAEARARMKEADTRCAADQTLGETASARQREVIRTICEHPWLYARIHLAQTSAVLLPAVTDVLHTVGVVTGERGTLKVLHAQGLIAAVRHYFAGHLWALALAGPLLIVTAVQYLGAVLCVLRGIRRRIPPEAWLLAALIVVTVLLPGPLAVPRYRLPIAPLLCVAAGMGLTRRRPAAKGPGSA